MPQATPAPDLGDGVLDLLYSGPSGLKPLTPFGGALTSSRTCLRSASAARPRRVFPTERTPSRVVETLWKGLGRPYWRGPDLGSLLEVRVIPDDTAEPAR